MQADQVAATARAAFDSDIKLARQGRAQDGGELPPGGPTRTQSEEAHAQRAAKFRGELVELIWKLRQKQGGPD
jgi:hypothetical protein